MREPEGSLILTYERAFDQRKRPISKLEEIFPTSATAAVTHRELLQESGRQVQEVHARPVKHRPQQLHETFPYLQTEVASKHLFLFVSGKGTYYALTLVNS